MQLSSEFYIVSIISIILTHIFFPLINTDDVKIEEIILTINCKNGRLEFLLSCEYGADPIAPVT